MMRRNLTAFALTLMGGGLLASPAYCQLGAVGDALQGAVDSNEIRAAVQSHSRFVPGAAAGNENVSENPLGQRHREAMSARRRFQNNLFQNDLQVPKLGADLRTNVDLDANFRARFGADADRSRFRYSDDHWWYRTKDDRWIYDRNGQWYTQDGRAYDGYDAYHVGNHHPRYRQHGNYWWYNTGNDWVFFNDGHWYTRTGDYYRPQRSGISIGAGPVRIDLFTGPEGRQYRYNNGYWWHRHNDNWFYARDGYWYNNNNERQGAISAELDAAFKRRTAREDVESNRFPPPPAAETTATGQVKFEGELPEFPMDEINSRRGVERNSIREGVESTIDQRPSVPSIEVQR